MDNKFALKGDIINFQDRKFDFVYRNPSGKTMILPVLLSPGSFFDPGKYKQGHQYYNTEIMVCFDYNKKGNIVLRCLSIKPKVNV